MWVTNRTEALKATAASTLSRLLRYNPGLLGFLLDKFGTRHFVAGALQLLRSRQAVPGSLIMWQSAIRGSSVPASRQLVSHPQGHTLSPQPSDLANPLPVDCLTRRVRFVQG